MPQGLVVSRGNFSFSSGINLSESIFHFDFFFKKPDVLANSVLMMHSDIRLAPHCFCLPVMVCLCECINGRCSLQCEMGPACDAGEI